MYPSTCQERRVVRILGARVILGDGVPAKLHTRDGLAVAGCGCHSLYDAREMLYE